MEPRIRYAKTKDGVRIAYCTAGEGPPLLLCPLLVESFSLDDTVPEFAEFLQKLGKGRTLVRFDVRGTGLSDRNPSDLSLEAQVLDLEAVVASEGIDRLVLMAPSSSGPCGIAFTARNPDVVAGLILYGTTGRGGHVFPPETAQALILLAKTNWPLAARTLADLAGREEFPSSLARYTDWYIMSAEGGTAGSILETRLESDVMDLLPQIRCPTLVLHRSKDPVFPFATGQALAAGIPGARLVPLPGVGHGYMLGEPEPVLRAIEGFLSQVAPREESRTREATSGGGKHIHTVLFTDVEGSTALTQRLGDAKARELLREQERMVREALNAHGGSEIKTLGDGFMTSFSSATKALECAIAMQRAFAERNESAAEPVKVRIGLNAGEPIAEDDPDGRSDLYGTAVNEAARITATAKGGEILVSNVVRELAKGKDFLFADLGETSLKGFDEPVRLYEVRWREEG